MLSNNLKVANQFARKITWTMVTTAVILAGAIGPAMARDGILKAQDRDAQINLRQSPDVNSRSMGYGVVGDRVMLLDQRTGTDGKIWYQVKFSRTGAVGWIRGDFVQAENPTREGVLQANDPEAQINLRELPDVNSRSLGYGVVNDRVTILDQKTGEDSYVWYKVKFPKSGATGWIRGTFVKVNK